MEAPRRKPYGFSPEQRLTPNGYDFTSKHKKLDFAVFPFEFRQISDRTGGFFQVHNDRISIRHSINRVSYLPRHDGNGSIKLPVLVLIVAAEMVYVWLTLFIVLIILFWGLNLVGLPGNWLIVATAVLWVFVGPDAYQFHWGVSVALTFLAILGELIEFMTSVLGTKTLGGSNRGATLSVIGSVVGGVLGGVFGIPFPIPLVGILIGSILFAGVGAWIGTTLGERWVGKPMKQSVKIGAVAFVGRLLGTAGKLMVGSTMVVLAIAAPFVPILTN